MTHEEKIELQRWVCRKVGHRCEILWERMGVMQGIMDGPIKFQVFCTETDSPMVSHFWYKHLRENEQYYDTPFEAAFEYVMRWQESR